MCNDIQLVQDRDNDLFCEGHRTACMQYLGYINSLIHLSSYLTLP